MRVLQRLVAASFDFGREEFSLREQPSRLSESDPISARHEYALSWAAERLDASGVTWSRREALDLWSAVTHADPAATLSRSDASVIPEHWSEFRSIVSRRAGGEPLAYTLGRAGFRTLELLVDRIA